MAYGFTIISLPSAITRDLTQGKEHVIENYFQRGHFGGHIIKSSPTQYWSEIVYTLFINYGVICNSDDESGYVDIPDQQFEK